VDEAVAAATAGGVAVAGARVVDSSAAQVTAVLRGIRVMP
jgi:hypothetical protein